MVLALPPLPAIWTLTREQPSVKSIFSNVSIDRCDMLALAGTGAFTWR